MSVPFGAIRGALPWRVVFGGTAGSGALSGISRDVRVDIPVLFGAPAEEIFPPAVPIADEQGLYLAQSGDLLLGAVAEPIGPDGVEAASERLYRRLVAACRDWHVYRVWNYVPRINDEVDGLEVYRAFCRARSLVLEGAWGGEFKQLLPSASAVGCEGGQVISVFAAGRESGRNIENPEQVPAYEYPREHGPRSPSFSRATLARANGAEYLFVSGTSAIKGHATVAEGSLAGQIACTLDNLRLVSRASGAGDRLGSGGGWTRHFKVYLRHAADLAPARALLEATLLEPADRVTWLRSDICRADLAVEVEATLVR
ncbi:hypothetical protein DB347_03180 [Opitutaceae bacterium EW11]|nr:hypothetical protein DB347_03180 [Opitutaceae bacterium EW11]